MKISSKSKTLLVVFSGLLLMACNKPLEEPELPELTHVGNNTFACYLDEEPFIARVNYILGGPIAVSGSFNEETKLLRIQGTREKDGHYENVAFKVSVDNGSDDYIMTAETAHFKGYIDSSGEKCFYFHDTLNRGLVEITHLDETKNIIAGRFSMALVNPECDSGTSMNMTEGRFDFGY